MGTTTLKSVTAIIDRDATIKLPATVFEYELPVLEAIHGEENISVVKDEEVGVEDFSASDAFNALLRKYPQHQNEVRLIYRNAQALGKAAGLTYDKEDDSPAKTNQAVIVKHKPAKKAEAKK